MYNVTITFNVNGQIISRNEKDTTLLSDSIDLIKARFNFSSEWQGYTKTAIFKSNTKKPYSRILVDDVCMVPPEAIKKSKYMSVSVFGVSGTQLITATDQIVPLTPSGYTDDSIVSPAPTENIYQQIVTLMQKQAVDAAHAETAQGKAEEARDDAKGHAEQTALDLAATSADRTAANEALTGFTETTLPGAIQAVEDKADTEISRVGQAGDTQVQAVNVAGAEQIGLATAQADRAEDSASAADAALNKLVNLDVSAETLAPGSNATVSKTKTETGYTLAFGVPRGDKGEQGDRGATGERGLKGDKGDTGDVSAAQMNTAISAAVDPVASQLAENADNVALWRKTTTGNPVTCYPVSGSPLLLKVSLVATQSGSGDPSPENIRPITPWLANGESVEVRRAGKNLNPYPVEQVGWSGSGALAIGNSTFAGCRYKIPVSPNTTYSISKIGMVGASPYYAEFDTNNVFIQRSLTTGGLFVTSSNAQYVGVYYYLSSGIALAGEEKIQLELGSTPTPYEPYSGDTYEWTATRDIYGLPGAEAWMANDGSEYDTTTLLTLTGNENWIKYGGSTIGYKMHGAFADNRCLEGISSHFKSITSPQLLSNVVGVYLSYTMDLIVNYDRATDVTEFKAWLAAQVTAGTPMQILCKRATPTTASGSAVSILALPQLDRYTPRQNVLTADKGALTVGYAKSPIRESDELQAAIAALS